MAPPRRVSGKKKGVVSVDFTGVEAGTGGGKLIDEGTHLFEIKEVEEGVGQDSKQPKLEIKFAVADPDSDFNGSVAYDNFSLQPQALWKLRGLLDAAGIETVDGPMEIDTTELVGCLVMGDVIHEEYNRKMKHRLNGYSAVEDDTTPAESTGARKKTAAAESEDDWKVGQKVTFKDGKKTIPGKITAIDGDDITVAVKGVSKDADGDYEMKPSDLSAA